MGAAENKKLLQDVFSGLSEGNSSLFVESMDDGFRWTVTGHTKWSKTYEGKQTVLRELMGALQTALAGRIRVRASRIVAEDDLVVVEAKGHNTTKAGKPYNNTYCFVFRVASGKLQEVTEYMDTQLVVEALSDVLP
jgi:ketosteroid isomerase-like protein